MADLDEPDVVLDGRGILKAQEDGRAPFALTWSEFEAYFERMTRTGVVRSMKDFYWDIRPKPEFGTLEIRVFEVSGDVLAIAEGWVRGPRRSPIEDPSTLGPAVLELMANARLNSGMDGEPGGRPQPK